MTGGSAGAKGSEHPARDKVPGPGRDVGPCLDVEARSQALRRMKVIGRDHMRRLRKTSPFCGPLGEVVPGSIAEPAGIGGGVVTGVLIAKPCGPTRSRWWSGRRIRRALLSAGIASAVVYVVGDVSSGLRYDGYSFRNQAISELSAFGSPVQPDMVTVILVHGVLLIAFGAGVLLVADQKPSRWIGAILMALGAVGFPTHTVWAMSSRGMKTGFNDTMHMTMSVVFSVLVAVAMVLVALRYRGWFRRFSLVTLAVVIGFGTAASMAIRGIKQNDTPWVGGFERMDAYAYLAWLVVLALVETRRAFGPKGGVGNREESEPKPTAA